MDEKVFRDLITTWFYNEARDSDIKLKQITINKKPEIKYERILPESSSVIEELIEVTDINVNQGQQARIKITHEALKEKVSEAIRARSKGFKFALGAAAFGGKASGALNLRWENTLTEREGEAEKYGREIEIMTDCSSSIPITLKYEANIKRKKMKIKGGEVTLVFHGHHEIKYQNDRFIKTDKFTHFTSPSVKFNFNDLLKIMNESNTLPDKDNWDFEHADGYISYTCEYTDIMSTVGYRIGEERELRVESNSSDGKKPSDKESKSSLGITLIWRTADAAVPGAVAERYLDDNDGCDERVKQIQKLKKDMKDGDTLYVDGARATAENSEAIVVSPGVTEAQSKFAAARAAGRQGFLTGGAFQQHQGETQTNPADEKIMTTPANTAIKPGG